MPTNNIARSRRLLRTILVLSLLVLTPSFARAQDAGAKALDEQALTPPSLQTVSAPSLPELPYGSEPQSVVLELTVATDGSARDAVVLVSAAAELERTALEAVSKLRFTPAKRGETPIEARIPFRFEFLPARAPEPTPAPTLVPAPPALPDDEALVGGVTLDVQGEKPPREATVHAIEIAESRQLPGTNGDPIRAIEALPGVARPPAVEGALIVRGSAPNDSAIFIDGIQIPLAYHFGNLAAVVPNDSLDKLEFRPGNFGAEYGRAMGGTVQLSLRSPRRDRLGGVLQLDTFDGRLMLEGPLGPRTRFMIGARRSWVDAWIGSVDENIKSAPVYYDGQAVLEHDFNERTTARLFFFGSDDRIKLLFEAPDAQDPGEGGKLAIGTRFTRLALRLDSKLTRDLNLRQTLSWGTDHFNVSMGPNFQEVDAHLLDTRAELRARWTDWVSGAVGIDAQVAKYHVQVRVPPYGATDEVESPTFAVPSRTFDEQLWIVRPSAYALLELTPVVGLRIVPGVRADYARDTKQLTLDPRITVRGDVHEGFPRTTLKGGFGFYSQPPQGIESIEPFGSKGVESNRAVHASAGIEQELARGLSISLEGFYKQLSKLVVATVAEREGVGSRFANTGDGRAYGGETLLRYRDPKGRYFGWLAYTLSRSERRNDRGESYRLFQYDQTHILSALGNVELGRGFSAGARFRYVTGSPHTPIVGGVLDLDAGAYAPVPGATFGGRLPAFHQLDARVDKTWKIGPTKLVAYLELRNAYNRKNTEQLSYRFDYSEAKRASGLPILPVIGLRGEL